MWWYCQLHVPVCRERGRIQKSGLDYNNETNEECGGGCHVTVVVKLLPGTTWGTGWMVFLSPLGKSSLWRAKD